MITEAARGPEASSVTEPRCTKALAGFPSNSIFVASGSSGIITAGSARTKSFQPTSTLRWIRRKPGLLRTSEIVAPPSTGST
jgi:hypothetical protein